MKTRLARYANRAVTLESEFQDGTMRVKTAPILNYQVSVVVSPDRRHYVSEMISSSKPCELALVNLSPARLVGGEVAVAL